MAENQPRDEQGRWTDGSMNHRFKGETFRVAAPLLKMETREFVRLLYDARRNTEENLQATLSGKRKAALSSALLLSRSFPDVLPEVLERVVKSRPFAVLYENKGREQFSLKGEAESTLAPLRGLAANYPNVLTVTETHDLGHATFNDPDFSQIIRHFSYGDNSYTLRANTFDPAQPRDDAGKWALSGSKLVGALTSLYSAQPTPPVDGKGWLRADGLFVDGGGVSHVAMLRAAYGDRKGKAPAFAEDMYRLAFHAGLVRYDRHAGVIEISDAPTEDQKTALRKMFDGLGTHEEIEVEVFRTPETRYYSEQDRGSHRRWMETSPDSMVEKVDAFYGFKGDGYASPLAQFRGNAFDPNQPRDPDGKWTGGTLNFSNEPERVGGFTKDVAVRRSTVMKGGERVTTWHNPDGSQITDPKLVARAEQLNGTIATAPNVKGAWLNPNLNSPLLAIAFDAKDRKQYIYSREFVQKNAEAKFKIVEQMEKDLPVMRKQAAAGRKAGTPEAFLFKLEDLTCIRVGSDKDTGAEKKAYGLTTLRGEHVKVEGDLIKLAFPAKGGESGSYTVKDRELATFITERKAVNGDGPLWPDVTAGKFNAYLKKLDPTTDSPVTAHKFRHYHATRIAAEVVARYEGEELNPKAFTRVQKEACEKAAAHLSNTWTVTREKYVNPTVWGRLTVKAG